MTNNDELALKLKTYIEMGGVRTGLKCDIEALLAERDADKKRIAELEARTVSLPAVQVANIGRDQLKVYAAGPLEAALMSQGFTVKDLPNLNRTVSLPTFEEYQPDIARELQGAFRIACTAAGIKLEVGE